MEFGTVPASNDTLPDLANLLNRGFAEYVIPVHFTVDMLYNLLRKDDIDLAESRILLANGQACGVALIARRPARHTSRLAAMGIAKETRGRKAGAWLLRSLIDDARQRGEREMVLEVIEQNEPAVRLYRSHGFETVRRLVGFTHRYRQIEVVEPEELHELNLAEVVDLISRHALPELPWQLSAETLSRTNPPLRAFREGPAYVVVSNPEAERVIVCSLLVEPEARGNGWGTKILQRMRARYGRKTWHVPAVFPEEMGKVFERAGFEKEKVSQWQMRLRL